MYESNLMPDKPYRKSVTTVGDVLGRYHPHGDASVYDALVRMAQQFSLRYPLIDGQGNFGSIDGDPAAAYRYTEARMSKIAVEMLTDIEKETIDYIPNFDGHRDEPTVLPAKIPALLVNGSQGIAVGMTTNIPPHNLGEVIDAIIEIIDNPECALSDIMEHIKGPDFPTGGIIMGMAGIRAAYATGKGRVHVRARAEIEDNETGKSKIVVTEIPYMTNKARLIENIAELVKDKRLEGISDLRDESDREGMRIVIELKRDANPQVLLNRLYKLTQMQTTFSIIMLALVDNKPRTLPLREILDHYIAFQREIIRRRTIFDLKKARDRAHILEGLRIALDNIDEIIRIIRSSYNDAKEKLMEAFGLTEIQAQAILDMRLARLQGLEREKIDAEYNDLMEKIKYYNQILESEALVSDILKTELSEIKRKYADERRTEIVPVENEIDIEDLIPVEECVYTLTHFGYIKRLPTSTYRAQRRGGKGITAMSTREEDFVETLFVASSHDHILFFTDNGRLYRLKGYMVPESSRTAKGTNIVNLLQLDNDEKVTAMIPITEFEEGKYLVMATKRGIVKRIELTRLDTARKTGIRAVNLAEDDDLIAVMLTDSTKQIMLATRNGIAIKFSENDIRPTGRDSAGVYGIDLSDEDYVVGAATVEPGKTILTVTENGFGKRTDTDEYRLQSRYGKGILNYNISDKTGCVAGILMVDDSDDVMLITDDGTIIRMAAEDISKYGRVTRGVILMRLDEGVRVISIASAVKEEDEEEDEQDDEQDGQSAE
jgi:DNA gyrase subunit A